MPPIYPLPSSFIQGSELIAYATLSFLKNAKIIMIIDNYRYILIYIYSIIIIVIYIDIDI